MNKKKVIRKWEKGSNRQFTEDKGKGELSPTRNQENEFKTRHRFSFICFLVTAFYLWLYSLLF